MKADYTDVRQHILDQGKAIITRKGFAGVGLNEILTAAAVPKGSFYHYFKSKELYGEALLADYVAQYLVHMDGLLVQPGKPVASCLMAYWDSWFSDMGEATGEADSCNVRCLVVKLSSEVADMSEPMRVALRDGTDQIIARLAAALDRGVADGSLPAVPDPADLAQTLYQLWLGAALLTKLRREPSALHSAWRTTLALLQLAPSAYRARG
ncbi:TetR family transcriptional regulator [Duganella sp. Leaf126]|uniref:TetR/AcrR family transcriptional regulator n=1 Tax=Duganella sp. Leaf126 TaxID=1736266 RepID=UPI000701DF76|nr:TetR/AcrR family transcriptional regulator [Duganella sp. Leaf126]KQQ33113.1 TetR family transcriptional regulator [Duganella sp. Leaf126]